MLNEPRMKKRILVVDDEEQIRDLLTKFFRTHGYEVSTAASSAEALRHIKERQPDLIVLDIGLNEEDGLKVLGTFKSLHPEIKVIMLTGMGLVEDLLQEAQQRGADAYVSKLMPLEELLGEVQRVLKKD